MVYMCSMVLVYGLTGIALLIVNTIHQEKEITATGSDAELSPKYSLLAAILSSRSTRPAGQRRQSTRGCPSTYTLNSRHCNTK